MLIGKFFEKSWIICSSKKRNLEIWTSDFIEAKNKQSQLKHENQTLIKKEVNK